MVKQQMHFISGLPRSGSTLLAAILKQNPRFHAGMSSPVGGLFTGLLAQVSAGSEFSSSISTKQRSRLLKGLFENYYADETDKEVIFDTSRSWCAKLPALLDLYPNAKIIACVRNPAWVMDSLERLYRNNPYENTRLFGDESERSTVYSRMETLVRPNRMVGFPWAALKEAFYSEQAKSLLVLDYDLLAQAPQKVLPLIYQFLEEKEFEHDFNHVEYDAPEFDTGLGLSGLHKVRPQVKFEPRPTVLPPEIFEKFNQMMFWQDSNNSLAQIIAPSQADKKKI